MTEQKTLYTTKDVGEFDAQANELRRRGWKLKFFQAIAHPAVDIRLFGVFEREIADPEPEQPPLELPDDGVDRDPIPPLGTADVDGSTKDID